MAPSRAVPQESLYWFPIERSRSRIAFCTRIRRILHNMRRGYVYRKTKQSIKLKSFPNLLSSSLVTPQLRQDATPAQRTFFGPQTPPATATPSNPKALTIVFYISNIILFLEYFEAFKHDFCDVFWRPTAILFRTDIFYVNT
jgi:hypothetical protein